MNRWPLIITILITFLSFGHGMYKMITPEMYREMSPPHLGYVYVPDDDTFTGTNQYLEIRFIEFGTERPETVTAWIQRTVDGQPEALALEPVIYGGEQADKWLAILPPLENKGDRWFYHLTIETSEGREIEIWKSMNWFEELFSGFQKTRQHFWVTYEGNVSRETPGGKMLLVSHIVLAFGALLIMFHTIYYTLVILYKPDETNLVRAYMSAFWAWLSFGIGTIALGIPITWYTFGCGYMPWPTQGWTSPGDITDTKSTWLVIWWGVILLTNFRVIKSALNEKLDARVVRRFAIWVLISLIATVLVFLIPHSQFMQTSH